MNQALQEWGIWDAAGHMVNPIKYIYTSITLLLGSMDNKVQSPSRQSSKM